MRRIFFTITGAIVALVILGYLVSIFAPSAEASGSPCFPGTYQTVKKKMKQVHGEVPVMSGASKNGMRIVIFVNPQTRTWTSLGFSGADRVCSFASGKDFQSSNIKTIPPIKTGKEMAI